MNAVLRPLFEKILAGRRYHTDLEKIFFLKMVRIGAVSVSLVFQCFFVIQQKEQLQNLHHKNSKQQEPNDDQDTSPLIPTSTSTSTTESTTEAIIKCPAVTLHEELDRIK